MKDIYWCIYLHLIVFKMINHNYELQTNYPSFSFFCLHFIREERCDKGLQKKEKQRFMYTGKSISRTSKTSFDNLCFLLWVICKFHLCVKMMAYSPSCHFPPSKHWESPCFEWGNRNCTLPWQFEISAFLFPTTNGPIWGLSLLIYIFMVAMNTCDSSSNYYSYHIWCLLRSSWQE